MRSILSHGSSLRISLKVFVAEDEQTIRTELVRLLTRSGFTCETAEEFDDLAGQILRCSPDIVLLDLGLPVLDGLTVLRELRTASDIPVLVLTSRDSEADELMGIHFGADDYVTKPFNPQILLARMEAIVRRSARSQHKPNLLRNDTLELDLTKGSVTGPSGTVMLTKNEQGILACMMRRPGEIVARDQIIEELWQSDSFVDDNTLTVNMTRLRAKLREVGAGDIIRTRRGQGYQL